MRLRGSYEKKSAARGRLIFKLSQPCALRTRHSARNKLPNTEPRAIPTALNRRIDSLADQPALTPALLLQQLFPLSMDKALLRFVHAFIRMRAEEVALRLS